MTPWDKSEFKTYDTSEGYGDPGQWRRAFNKRMNKDKKNKKTESFLKPLYSAKTADELKQAYRKLLVKYHPDRAGDTPANTRKTQKIVETYNKLKDTFDN
jgi:DnaJ-domain-containing protein 1